MEVVADGRRLVSFAGCDYLGLARHPGVVAAAHEALDRCGAGATASRTTTGTWLPHVELERALADWMGSEDAAILPSGFLAGTALAAALAPGCDVVLLDAGAHPALRDAARLTGLPVREFPHFDAAALGVRGHRPLVLTDAVDVATGTLAPLRQLRRVVVSSRGALVVDDAHGVGVLGTKGRGTASALRATGPRVHTAGSLSKALGAHGGFVTGTRRLCDAVRAQFGGYAGGTPIPPSTAAAAAVAVRIARRGDALRRRLAARCASLRLSFVELGLPAPPADVPWFAIGAAHVEDLAEASRTLAHRGLLVPHVRYFGAPSGGYLKIALSAAHTAAHVDALESALRDVVTSPPSPRR